MQRLLLIPAVCFALSVPGAAAEPATVHVQLKGGRSVSGHVDSRTDESHLRLSLAATRIRLTTVIPWQEIESVRSADEEWTLKEFQSQWPKLAVDVHPAEPHLKESVSSIPRVAREARGRIAAIAGDAWLGRWNRRPGADGLMLNLVVLDAAGQQIVSGGQLDVQLYGLRQGERGGWATFDRKPDVLQLERWGYPVEAGDFKNGTLQVRLPFRRLRPEQAIDVADNAFLRVRFGVPKQGIFEVSLTDVFIRDFSLFRDDLHHATGSRLLPFEKP